MTWTLLALRFYHDPSKTNRGMSGSNLRKYRGTLTVLWTVSSALWYHSPIKKDTFMTCTLSQFQDSQHKFFSFLCIWGHLIKGFIAV